MSKEVEQLKKHINTNLTQWLNSVVDDIAGLKYIEPVKISKEEFETNFMPFLIGLVERNELNTHIYTRNVLDKTNDNYHTPLLVVDENDKPLYLLPPFVISVDQENLRDISFATLIAQYDNYKIDNPFKANELITKSMSELSKIIDLPENYIKFLREIARINRDYGHLKDGSKKPSTTNNTPVEEEEEDLFDY